jgi:hypothetical protein
VLGDDFSRSVIKLVVIKCTHVFFFSWSVYKIWDKVTFMCGYVVTLLWYLYVIGRNIFSAVVLKPEPLVDCKKWIHVESIEMCVFYVFCIYEAWHWNIECPEADFCDKRDGRSAKTTSNFLSSWKELGRWSLFLSDMEGGTFFMEFGNVCSSITYSRPCIRVSMKVIRILI